MKIKQLTFTRFLAAISIVVFHFGKKSFLFNNTIVKSLFFNADVCVSYFFILSGFVMIIAYKNKSFISAKDYYVNRFARIYPLYFLSILLTLFLQIRTDIVDFLGLFLNILMLQAWVPVEFWSFNPPGWSLSVEFFFYAIFPFLFNRILKKKSLKKISLLIVLFWFFSQLFTQILFLFYSESKLIGINGTPLLHLNEFLIGNLAGLFFVKKWHKREGNYDLQILMLFGLFLIVLKIPFQLNYLNGLLAILFIPLITLISLNNGFITKLFEKKVFVFLGEISYGIYILQFPIYSLISAYSVKKYLQITEPTVVFFLRLIVLIVVSALSYVFLEKPIMEKIKTKKGIASIVSNLSL